MANPITIIPIVYGSVPLPHASEASSYLEPPFLLSLWIQGKPAGTLFKDINFTLLWKEATLVHSGNCILFFLGTIITSFPSITLPYPINLLGFILYFKNLFFILHYPLATALSLFFHSQTTFLNCHRCMVLTYIPPYFVNYLRQLFLEE